MGSKGSFYRNYLRMKRQITMKEMKNSILKITCFLLVLNFSCNTRSTQALIKNAKLISHIQWEEYHINTNITIKKAQTHLFDAPQAIHLAIIDMNAPDLN